MWYIRAGRCRGAQIFTILIGGPPVTTNIWAGARKAQGFFGDSSLYLDAISRIGTYVGLTGVGHEMKKKTIILCMLSASAVDVAPKVHITIYDPLVITCL